MSDELVGINLRRCPFWRSPKEWTFANLVIGAFDLSCSANKVSQLWFRSSFQSLPWAAESYLLATVLAEAAKRLFSMMARIAGVELRFG